VVKRDDCQFFCAVLSNNAISTLHKRFKTLWLGYLLTRPAPGSVKLRGSDASHAWVSVYIPDFPQDQRWCDLDPTNNRYGWHSPGEDYVTLATGRDFADVSPIRGVIHGGASHTLAVGVTVEQLK